MRKLWQDDAWEEYIAWQTEDKKTLKKINRLLKDIDRNGYQCTGKPEPLKGNLEGYYSVLRRKALQTQGFFVLCRIMERPARVEMMRWTVRASLRLLSWGSTIVRLNPSNRTSLRSYSWGFKA